MTWNLILLIGKMAVSPWGNSQLEDRNATGHHLQRKDHQQTKVRHVVQHEKYMADIFQVLRYQGQYVYPPCTQIQRDVVTKTCHS